MLGRMRLYVLDLGWMRMEGSLLFRGPDPSPGIVEIPISAYCIDHPDGRVLFDAGCHPDSMGPTGRWPAEYQAAYPYLAGAECQLPNRLEQLGLGPDDFRYVVLSHLHSDHAGCVEFFSKSTLVVHEDELAVAMRLHRAGERASTYCWDDIDRWTKLDLDWRKVGRNESRLALNDRVTIHNWGRGHADGMLGLEVRLRERPGVILTSDAIYCRENYEPPMYRAGFIEHPAEYDRTVEEIRALAVRTGCEPWFGHDPRQFPMLRKSTEGWYE